MKDWIIFHIKSEQILIQSSKLKDNTRDFEEILTVNQDLVEEELNTLKS